jgi:hypothetical protein
MYRIEQIIYREIWFVGEPSIYSFGPQDSRVSQIKKFLVAVDARPASFFVERVKAVHFSGHFEEDDTVQRVLAACSRVTNLGFYVRLRSETPTGVYNLVHSLYLERLFVGSEILEGLLADNPPADSSLSKITHLCVVSGSVNQPQLLHFPKLTHLALLSDFEGNFASPLKHALSHARVKCIVVMVNSRSSSNSTAQAREVLKLHKIDDPRIVIFTLPMSQKIFYDDDIWDLANEFPDEEDDLVGRPDFLLRFYED